jgi:hypothetical protein
VCRLVESMTGRRVLEGVVGHHPRVGAPPAGKRLAGAGKRLAGCRPRQVGAGSPRQTAVLPGETLTIPARLRMGISSAAQPELLVQITPNTLGLRAYASAFERQVAASHSPVRAIESSQAWKAIGVLPAFQCRCSRLSRIASGADLEHPLPEVHPPQTSALVL